jgi:hypothetical protein
MTRVPHQELRQRLAARNPGLEPPDDTEADAVFGLLLGVVELAHERKRRPEVRRKDCQSTKALRHHPDNLERHAVHLNHAAEHGGIVREISGPGAMAEDDDATVARLVI